SASIRRGRNSLRKSSSSVTKPPWFRRARPESVMTPSYESTGDGQQLPDRVEEAEHPLLDQRRRGLVVIGEAAVREQVSIARVKEQLRVVHGLGDLAGDLQIFVGRCSLRV